MPNKSASARGIQTDFLNYRLVVIKARRILFHPPVPCIYTDLCQGGYGGCEAAITSGLPQKFWGYQRAVPTLDPEPRLLGREFKKKLPLQIKHGTQHEGGISCCGGWRRGREGGCVCVRSSMAE